MTDATPAARTAVIVEDDPDIRHLLVEVLEAAGFSTVSVGNGLDGVQAVLSYQPLITTLDVNMPGIDGIEAARRIRAQSDTYIIMITALGEELDVVLGLTAGADEYITKPFRPREFRARIEAMLRRPRPAAAPAPRTQESAGPSFRTARSHTGSPNTGSMTAPPNTRNTVDGPAHGAGPSARTGSYQGNESEPGLDDGELLVVAESGSVPSTRRERSEAKNSEALGSHVDAEGQWYTHRNLRLNIDTRIVVIDGNNVDLTRTEFDLLAALMESRRRVRSKADLTLVLRGESYVTTYFVGDADKRAIEAHITNLRRKIGDSSTQPKFVETVRGVGYRLTSDAPTAP